MSSERKALTVLLVLVAVSVLVAAGSVLWIQHSINSRIQHLKISEETLSIPQPVMQSGVEHSAVNFLILGSDSRSSNGSPERWAPGEQRSDVIMLVQLSADRRSLAVMSIPRDSWVSIPGHGKGKLNSAYSLGGPDLAVATVKSMLDVPIHHFIIVDFASFQHLTDVLGGVEIDTADGPQSLNGEQALEFVRERYSLPNGDFDRVRRQQAWIRAIMVRVFESDALSSPRTLSELSSVLLENSAMDPGLDARSLLSLGLEANKLRPSQVFFFTAPYSGVGTSPDGQSIVTLNMDELTRLSQAWRDGRIRDFLQDNDRVTTLNEGDLH